MTPRNSAISQPPSSVLSSGTGNVLDKLEAIHPMITTWHITVGKGSDVATSTPTLQG